MRQTAHRLTRDADAEEAGGEPLAGTSLKPLLSSAWLDKIHNCDCIEGMKKMPAGCVDLVLTDPPFAIGFQKAGGQYNRKSANVLQGYNEIEREKYFEFTLTWLTECNRILKGDGSMFLISGWSNLRDVLNAVEEVGLHTVNHLIWKYQFGVFTKKKFVTSHYHVLFLAKNKKSYTFNKIDHYPEDVFFIKRDYWTNKVKTPTRLPEALVDKLILYGSNAGDVVLDPFIGSGTTAACAKKLTRRYTGFEINPDYADFARKRLKQVQRAEE